MPGPLAGGFSNCRRAARMMGASGTLPGCTLPGFTAAFIGESATPTVSFRRADLKRVAIFERAMDRQ